jgi:hypothetical protein
MHLMQHLGKGTGGVDHMRGRPQPILAAGLGGYALLRLDV